MGSSEDVFRVDNCDLCEAARITPWFHEDDICWIAECEICATPMVVWRGHGVNPPSDQLTHMHEQLAMVVESTSTSSTTSTTTCAISLITTTRTRARRAASSDMACGASTPMAEPQPIRDDTFPMRGWGLPEPGELERIVVVSPHLDDAVLSCARLMAANPGCTVVTLFVGNPPEYPKNPQRLWDVQSGFGPDDDVMEARRHEDAAALAVLDAWPVHLDFIEHTYLPNDTPVQPDVLAPALAGTLQELQPTLVVAPFGLANPDHDVTHKACMLVRDQLGVGVSWWCYEDSSAPKPLAGGSTKIPATSTFPGCSRGVSSRLFRRDLWPTPVCPVVDEDNERKMKAVNCYPSQLYALDDDWNIREKLAPQRPSSTGGCAPSGGWEGRTERAGSVSRSRRPTRVALPSGGVALAV